MIFILASCSTSQKVTVSGISGTEIYIPGETSPIGKIPRSGQVQIELKDKTYHPFLLSKSYGSDIYVPFALDYKHKNVAGVKFLNTFGWVLASAGLAAEIPGIIIALADDEDPLGPILYGGGVGLLGMGAALGAPAEGKLDQETYRYEVQYLNKQHTNGDISITQPVYETAEKVIDSPSYSTSHKSKSSKKNDEDYEYDSPKKKIESDVVKRQIKNYGKAIEGSYNLSGELTQKGEVIEDYNDMKVIITRVSNEEVSVTIIDEAGEDFFGKPASYNVKKESDGTYTLTHSKIKNATIKINPNGKIVYYHPRVNISDEIYKLQLEGDIQ